MYSTLNVVFVIVTISPYESIYDPNNEAGIESNVCPKSGIFFVYVAPDSIKLNLSSANTTSYSPKKSKVKVLPFTLIKGHSSVLVAYKTPVAVNVQYTFPSTSYHFPRNSSGIVTSVDVYFVKVFVLSEIVFSSTIFNAIGFALIP